MTLKALSIIYYKQERTIFDQHTTRLTNSMDWSIP